MIKLIKILLIYIICFCSISFVFADDLDIKVDNIKKWTDNRNEYIDRFWIADIFFWWTEVWEKWASRLLINIAKDVKNVAIAVAVIFLIVLVLRLLFSSWTEDDIKKWKAWIMWLSIWIMIMQISFTTVTILFDENIWATTAAKFTETIIQPIIRLLELLASFVFISIAIFSFYKIITSSWQEDSFKKWVQTIISSLIGFILIKISTVFVNSIYWKVKCEISIIGTTICEWDGLWNPNLSEVVVTIWKIIQFTTWFIWIITVILIIYSWIMLILSRWNEEYLKKFKSSLLYIFIWILIIVTSVILFRFISWWEFANMWTYNVK